MISKTFCWCAQDGHSSPAALKKIAYNFSCTLLSDLADKAVVTGRPRSIRSGPSAGTVSWPAILTILISLTAQVGLSSVWRHVVISPPTTLTMTVQSPFIIVIKTVVFPLRNDDNSFTGDYSVRCRLFLDRVWVLPSRRWPPVISEESTYVSMYSVTGALPTCSSWVSTP